MGASDWDHYTPYTQDLAAAFRAVRAQAFADGDYLWAGGSAPRPSTMDELFEVEAVQEEGTHSVLDLHELVPAGQKPGWGQVSPLTEAELLSYTGTDRPTREHVKTLLKAAVPDRWTGRCAVLHDADGQPSEWCFLGCSGD